MKRYLQIMVAALMVVAIATPVLAEVEWKFGGQFRARYIFQQNLTDANDDNDDANSVFDQRLRMYFTAKASENLKVVVRFEMGDTIWGQSRTDVYGGGGRMGADQVIVELKNAFVEFKIPETPTTAIIGIQGINLMNSWIADDDFAAAVFKTKFDPVVVSLGYIGGQNNPDRFAVKGVYAAPAGLGSAYPLHTENDGRLDAFFLAVDYAQGPLSASLIGMYSDARSTAWGLYPMNQTTPIGGNGIPVLPGLIQDNNIFDIGLNIGYKIDYLSAYATFVKNFGSVDLFNVEDGEFQSRDYTGWMVDAGATYFCGPYTLNIGGFYTSGREMNDHPETVVGAYDVFNEHGDDLSMFTYPVTTAKYFSEILGGGILDNWGAGFNNNGWNGYQFPTNLWTVTVGGSWQVLEKTKLSLSYWYFGTSEDVLSSQTEVDALGNITELKKASDIGHEIDFYITQGIVDGLTLDLVAAYLIAGDAYQGPFKGYNGLWYSDFDPDNVYELGARLQWNF